jgi:hypothetical protein
MDMELKEFVATHVSPGQPLTAQAWNDIVDALDGVHQFIAATQHAVRVKITTPGVALGSVRVTAQRGSEPPFEAVRPVPPDDHHVIVGLEPGAYTVRAEAPGFAVATAPLTNAAAPAELEIALTPNGALMPDLFGKTLADARAALGALTIPLSRLLDFSGNEIASANPGRELDDTLVLVQQPPAGTAVPPGQSAQLVIAVPPRIESAIEVPSLAGMTLVEAQKALEALGLSLGKVRTLRKGAA